MTDDVKRQLLDWSEGFAAVLDAPVDGLLDVPPSTEIDIIACPHCEGTNCEVWNGTEATCPECSAEFRIPVLAESSAKAIIIAVTEASKQKNSKTKVGAAGATDTGRENEKRGSVKRKDAAQQQMPFV